MPRIGYYIITAEQAAVLDELQISYEDLGGLKCVQDWDAVIAALDEKIWEDGEISDEEGAWYDTMSEYQNYLYWSTEAHSWV